MSKKRYIIFVLMFALVLSIFSNVNAESYGYMECNGKRWSPDNDCRVEDGKDDEGNTKYKIQDNATIVNDALTVYFDGSGNVTKAYELATSDKVKVPRFYFEVKPGLYASFLNPTNIASTILNAVIPFSELRFKVYAHDYRPIIDYYKTVGHAPEVIAADVTGFHVKVGDGILLNAQYEVITYYPSDLYTKDESKVVANIASPASVIADIFSSQDSGFWQDNGYATDATAVANAILILQTPITAAPTGQLASTVYDYREVYYFSNNLSADANINSCVELELLIKELEKVTEEKKSAEKGDTTADEKQAEILKTITNACDYYTGKKHKTSKSDCYQYCVKMDNIINQIDPTVFEDTNECGLGQDLIGWLLRILKIVRYIVPIIVIVLSTIDYIGAISSAEDDAMKKAGAKFSKRIFIMILIFLIPSLLQFIFNIFDVPGLHSGNPYCLK